MAKTSILTVMIQLAKQGNGDRETIKGLSQIKQQVGLAMGAFAALAGVGYTLNKGYQQTAQVFLDYADEVRDVGRNSGISAEESSKLIQVGDDLTITFESLQKSLWNANKNGFEVSIDALATMADEYVALGSATEQADYLVKRFGKGGEQMGKMLEKGGEGVKKMTSSIEGSLVLTGQAVAMAQIYGLELDNLQDKVFGAQVGFGQWLVGTLSGTTAEIEKQARAIYDDATGSDYLRDQLFGLDEAQQKAWDSAKNMATEQWMVANGLQVSGDAAQENALQMQEAAAAAQRVSAAQGQLIDVAFQLQGVQDNYKKGMAELTTEQGAQKAAWDQAKADYAAGKISYEELNAAAGEYQTQGQATAAQIQQLAAEHEMAMKRIVFSIIQAGVAADGLQEGEGAALMAIAVKLKLIDQNTADMAGSMIDSFGGVTNAAELSKIQTSAFNEDIWIAKNSQGTFRYKFVITTSGSIPNFSGMTRTDRLNAIDEFGAAGSGLSQTWAGGQLGNDWTVVGDAPGGGLTPYSELISPSGYVFNNQQTMALIDAGLVPGVSKREGDFSGSDFTPTPSTAKKRTGIGGTTVARVRQDSLTGATSNGQTSMASAESQAAMQAATETNVGMSAAVKEMTSVSTTAFLSMAESNQSVIEELQGMRKDMQKLQDTTVRAVRENLQQVLT